MNVEFSYATKIVIAIFIVAVFIYSVYHQDETDTDTEKPIDNGFKDWNLTYSDFNSN